jgi:GNAT superfamily N-acetyltransferase
MRAVRAARPEDVAAIVELITDLADYERLAHEVEITEDALHRALFAPAPAAHAHVVDHEPPGGERIVAGFALWFLNFSTWTGVPGIHLEDLYVRPGLRGNGYGAALLRELAALCNERGYKRLEWSVLDWNEPSIGFYRSVGAVPMEDWTTFRLTGDALAELASQRRGSGARSS